MRKRWLALVLGLVPSIAWAQCQPTNSPTLDLSNSAALTPAQYAAQGGLTATITLQAYDANGNPLPGSVPSHRLTVSAGTWGGTWVGTTWATSANAGFGEVYYTAGSDPTHHLIYVAKNGSIPNWWLPSNVNIGSVFHLFVVATNSADSTQDVATLTIGSGTSPSVISQDNLPSNSYLLASLNYNGTPNIPYQTTCTNAAEKDMLSTAQLNLSNTTSGENRNGVSFQGATTVVGQSVSATAYDYISFVPATSNGGVSFPGDVITVGAGGFIYCSAIGDFWDSWKNFQGTAEVAVTFSQVTGFVGQNASLRNWCLLEDIPPDYNPNILLNAQPGATYAWGTAILFNSTWNSGTWLVFGPGLAYSLTGTYTRKPCTHNPPPY